MTDEEALRRIRASAPKIRALQQRMRELRAELGLKPGEPLLGVFDDEPPRPSRWREAGLMLEEVLIQICQNPVAAIVGAILIGLASAVLQVECGSSPGP